MHRFVIRFDNKYVPLNTNEECNCIQIWSEKTLLTAKPFRLFTWNKIDKKEISLKINIECNRTHICGEKIINL